MNEDKIKELQTKLDELQKQLDELKKQKSLTRWRAGEDDYYCYIGAHYGISTSTERKTGTDQVRYTHGNYFPLELKDHIESETVMQIRFIQQMTVICWQLESKRMGKFIQGKGNKDFRYKCLDSGNGSKYMLAGVFNFTTEELASQAWEMLSEDVREWLKK